MANHESTGLDQHQKEGYPDWSVFEPSELA
jgi:hypothetical protein